MKIKFELNGESISLNKNPAEKLSVFLKQLKLIGCKEGCSDYGCTSCTVLMNGVAVPSCLTSLAQCDNTKITTLDEFKKSDEYADIKKGFEQAKVRMCGYCNAGKIFMANQIINAYYRPTKEEIRNEISFFECKCTELDSLVDGIYLAAASHRARTEKILN